MPARHWLSLRPKTGEEAALAQARLTLQRNERAVEDLTAVLEHLSGSQGAVARLRQAARRLERSSAANPDLAALLTHLDRSIEQASEAEAQLERLSAHMAADPARLEAIEARLFDLRALARKYRCEVDALPALHAQFIAQAQNIANLDEQRLAAQKQVSAARERYAAQAQSLYQQHQEAARTLAHAVNAELAPLKLEKAQFQVSLTLLEEAGWSSAGVHRASFEVATNPGAAFGPLNKIASGGELARFTLALKVALAQANSASTLIFDEVDRGVGGAVAAAIGERLKRLASHAQILLVTHSPQVAAAGSAHYRIEKQTNATGTNTHVSVLDQSARRHEIARMLSGDTITPEALAQADRLLASAQ
jgi:DNA repair protein RecN (Recombination protein N)